MGYCGSTLFRQVLIVGIVSNIIRVTDNLDEDRAIQQFLRFTDIRVKQSCAFCCQFRTLGREQSNTRKPDVIQCARLTNDDNIYPAICSLSFLSIIESNRVTSASANNTQF